MLVTAGLLIEPEGGGASYDRFRNRVIFPIQDRRGRVIAFGGRALGEAQAKYLNSPDTPVFHKGAVLYGMHLARSVARKSGRIIAVEGYMDVIGLSKNEIELGSILPTRDLTFVLDTCQGFIDIYNSDTLFGKVTNIGMNQEISIGKLVDLIAELMDTKFIFLLVLMNMV